MSAPSEIIDRIASLPSNKAILLIADLYDLILEEKYAWNAYSDRTQLTSTHTFRAHNTSAIDQAKLRRQILHHLTQTLPARLAILTVKCSHHPEDGNGNGVKVARMARSLQGMRDILLAGYPILFQLVDDIVHHEVAYTVLEVEHAHTHAVESVRVAMMQDFAHGRIVATENVVVFAERMLSIGISLEGLFEMRGAHGIQGVLGELGGVGILPWW
jgi:hypothetical protein